MEELAAGLGDLTRNREALALLILQGERAVPALTEILLSPASSIPEPRCLAAEALGAIGGEEAVSALIRVFMAHDTRTLDPVLRLAEEAVRNRAAEQLGKLGDRRAVGPLIHALAREGVREAMAALARFGEPRAIPLIVRRLEDPCDRAAAADALRIFGAAAVPALVATLTEHRPSAADEALTSVERRAEAARLLGMLGDTSVAPALRWCLDDPAPALQIEAALALVALRAAEAPERALAIVALGMGHPSVPLGVGCEDALVTAGDRSIPFLLSVGPPRAAPADHPRQPSDDALQVMAIEALERIGTDAATRALDGFLQDRSSLVRRRAQRALQQLGDGASGRDARRSVGS
jgi:HEAT repeat protein